MSTDATTAILRLAMFADLICDNAPDDTDLTWLRDDAETARRFLERGALVAASEAARNGDMQSVVSMLNTAQLVRVRPTTKGGGA